MYSVNSIAAKFPVLNVTKTCKLTTCVVIEKDKSWARQYQQVSGGLVRIIFNNLFRSILNRCDMYFYFKGKQQKETMILKVIFSLIDLNTNHTILWWSAWEVMMPDDWFTVVLFSSNVRRFGLRHKSQEMAQ